MEAVPVNKWRILLSVLLGSFTVILNNSMLNVAVPSFMALFKIKATTAEWVVIGYMVTVVMSMTLNGYLTDRFGQKKVYLTGIFLFLSGSLLGAFSWDFASVVVFRALQGIGGGLVMPLGLTLVYQVFPVKERGLAAGIWGVTVMMAPAIGPMIGGAVMSYGSWKWLFLINIPSGLFCAAMLSRTLRAHPREAKRPPFDKWGFVSVSVGLVSLLIGLSLLHSFPAVWSLSLIAAGLAALVVFVRHEMASEHPLIDIRIFRNRVFTMCSLIAAISSGSLFAGVLLIPLYLQDVLKLSSLVSGWVLFPQALCMGVASTVGGRLLDKQGAKVILPLGLVLTAAMSSLFGAASGIAGLYLLSAILVLRGVGMGLMGTPATTASMNELDTAEIPRAVSANNVIRQMSGAMFSACFSLFYEWRKNSCLPWISEKSAGLEAIKQSFWLLGLIAALAVPAALWVIGRERKLAAASNAEL